MPAQAWARSRIGEALCLDQVFVELLDAGVAGAAEAICVTEGAGLTGPQLHHAIGGAC